MTLENLQEFVALLGDIAHPDDEIDIYLDGYAFLGHPVSEGCSTTALVMGRIVEEVPDDAPAQSDLHMQITGKKP